MKEDRLIDFKERCNYLGAYRGNSLAAIEDLIARAQAAGRALSAKERRVAAEWLWETHLDVSPFDKIFEALAETPNEPKN
jgi:hypothetical protein